MWIFFSALLLFAAVRDYQTKEVPDWVWLVGLCGLPIAIYRVVTVGFVLLYGIQVGFVFLLVIVSFRIGILGGADGKALLLISLLYPWIALNPLWLILAPVVVLLGGFLLLGVHSLWLLFRNVYVRRQLVKTLDSTQDPEKVTFWLTRRLTVLPSKKIDWVQVEVPLIVYFFVSYIALVILTGLSL